MRRPSLTTTTYSNVRKSIPNEYPYYLWTKETYLRWRLQDNNHAAIAGINTGALAMMLLVFHTLLSLIVLILPTLFMAGAALSVFPVRKQTLTSKAMPKGLKDAFDGLAIASNQMRAAAALSPEGESAVGESFKFDRMVHQLMTEMSSLQAAERIAVTKTDRNSPLWIVNEELRQQSETLIAASGNFCDSVAYARASNLQDRADHGEVKEFSESAQIRMQIYRSLATGDDQKKEVSDA